MARLKSKEVKNGVEYTYLTHCCGQTRKQIAKQYGVPIYSVRKIDSYMATIQRELK